MLDLVKVAATSRSIGYLPEFVAQEFGFFTREGIEVESHVPPQWEDVLPEIESGAADLALGGIWVPAMYHGRGRDLVATTQLRNRVPFTLVGRTRSEASQPWWEQVQGKRVVCPGRGGASLGIFVRMLLKERSVDESSVRFIPDLSDAMSLELFEAGMADFILMDALAARVLTGHPGYVETGEFVRDGGAVPWSVYYATRATLDDKAEIFTRFSSALAATMAWMNERNSMDYLPNVLKDFPGIDRAAAAEIVEESVLNGAWTGTQIALPALDRWQRGIADGSLIEAPLDPTVFCASFALQGSAPGE